MGRRHIKQQTEDKSRQLAKKSQSALFNNKRSVTKMKSMKTEAKAIPGAKKPTEQVSIEYGSLKITGSPKQCMPVLEREQNKKWNYKYLMAAVAILLLVAAILYKQQWIIPALPGLFISGKSLSFIGGAIKKYNERRHSSI